VLPQQKLQPEKNKTIIQDWMMALKASVMLY